MKWLPRAALVLGVVLGVAFVVWWMRIRQLPTLRVSYTLGKGRDVAIEWIDLKS